MTETIIAALIAACVSVGVVLINNHYGRKKIQADSDATYQEMAIRDTKLRRENEEYIDKLKAAWAEKEKQYINQINSLMDKLQEKIAELERMETRYGAMFDDMKRNNLALEKQLSDCGIIPVTKLDQTQPYNPPVMTPKKGLRSLK